ncbi:MAG: bifunctional phosphoserine phosphatase/homoserine phosphotransferase ThrH [Myxococcota bacterium]|nr:bifunctional phosphoserine phosphatase/homoserine phosphotransferase ThrH [Myxococcota bacterium]
MPRAATIACLDLEGVLIPEVWVGLAERSGVDELRLTTRDIPDYDELMTRRLGILAERGIGMPDLEAVITELDPLPGAAEFLDWLRERMQVVILSDTFYSFARPFMRKLGWPTLFCHNLGVSDEGRIESYHLRQADPKRKAVQAFHGLNFQVIATGDSYNDTTMLSEADAGILFRPPNNVVEEFPQFPVTHDYDALRREFEKALASLDDA